MIAFAKPDNIIALPQKSNEIASQAALWYNEDLKLLTSAMLVTSARLRQTCIGGSSMDTLSPHADNGNSPRRNYRTGPLPRPLAQRFWEKVDIRSSDECWEWKACTYHHGYGKFALTRSNPVYAHRIAYELTYGAISASLLVCHTCDNRLCCNPKHLFTGTQKDNMQDCKRKGRLSPPPHNKRKGSG